ncbi:MAG: hypothetical protein IKI11_10895, partial [Neisseriaceae bacterium]|nr:hypothetical protein [Neisseriaceae bacterium]
NGDTQEVLVPQVYLAKASSLKGSNGTKTLISAREIDLAIDELNNTAIIQTQGNNLITANRIKNNDGGEVSGSVVVLHAKDKLNNDGGSVRGKNAVGLYSDKDISLQTTTYSTENKIGKSEFSRTGIANVSQVTVENPDGIIDIQAKTMSISKPPIYKVQAA